MLLRLPEGMKLQVKVDDFSNTDRFDTSEDDKSYLSRMSSSKSFPRSSSSVLPASLSFWKKKLEENNHQNVQAGFIDVLRRNDHENPAKFLILCINKLFGVDSDLAKFSALKVIFLALKQYLISHDSKNFIGHLDMFISKYPGVFSDLNDFNKRHIKFVEFVYKKIAGVTSESDQNTTASSIVTYLSMCDYEDKQPSLGLLVNF
jgi:hypothetical protein